MTAKVPIRAVFDGSTATGLAEYQSGEFIALSQGGLGASLSLGTANQILKVNSGETALEFGSIVGTGALDSGSITSGFGAIDNGTSNIRSATITAETAFVPDAADGASLGTSSLEFSDLFLADGGTITLGNDQDITITHVADTGINIKNVSTSGNSGIGAVLTLQTGDTDIAINNVLGQIDFQAPNEGTASDAVLVAASISAVSEGDFSSSNNATKLSFKTSASEVATEKMSLSSGGNLTVSGNVSVGGDLDVTGSLDMSDANLTNVGSIQLDSIAGDGDTNSSITFSGSDVITIATGGTTAATFNANQILTLADDLIIKDGGTIGSSSDTDAITIASSGVVTMGQIPVFSAGVNVSGGTIAGTLATAAQTNITSLGTLTALQIDNININGNAISSTAGTDLTITPVSGQQIVLDGTIVVDAGVVTGATSITSTDFVGDVTGNVTGTADVATVATTVTITDNESTNESNALIFTAGGDVDGGNLGLESDGTLTYNPSTGIVTATGFAGALTGNVTGNASGTAATVTGAAQTNITSVGTLTALTVDNLGVNGNTITANSGALNLTPASGSAIVLDGTINVDAGVVTGATSITSTAFVGDITGDVTGTADVATVATTVTITDNESTNENNAIVFTSGGDLDGGNLGLESDGDLKYNPSTGTLSVTNIVVSGTQTITDSVTMNASNAVLFEGSTPDAHETTLTSVDATGDRTISLPNVSGTLPVLAAGSTTQITSTPEELNILDGATVVVGEINALDLGSTAVGNAIASKAVILDSNKDYTGMRNLTISGEIDAATGDFSGAVDVAGATTTAAITASGIIKTDDSTAATSTTDGSLQTDGGLSVVLDAVIGDDLFMLSDAAVLTMGADKDVTLTHVHDTGILLNSTNVIQFNDASQNIGAPSATVLDINATDEIELNATLVDVNANLDVSGSLTIAGSFTPAALTASGIIKTDDATEATSTTDGSLQTDGGLSVVKDAVFGDDVKLLSDAAVLGFGADGDVTLTHVADTGLLLNGTSVIQFNDASQNIGAPSNAILDINATDEVEINATLIDINGNVEISGTATTTGVHTFTAVPVFPNNTIESADIQADAITGAKIADDAINSEHYTNGSIDTAHIAADQIVASLIADNALDSEHYTDGSIDRAHLAADIIDGTKIADDVINSEHYAADSIDAEHYAAGSVDATALASNAVTTAKINADAVTGAKIADDAINSEHYTNGSIDTAHIAADQIVASLIADNALDSEHYTDGSIDRAHLAADIIDGTKIADDAIDSEHYTDGSIDTAHIANGAVTQAKMSKAGMVLQVLSANMTAAYTTTSTSIVNPTGLNIAITPSATSSKILIMATVNMAVSGDGGHAFGYLLQDGGIRVQGDAAGSRPRVHVVQNNFGGNSPPTFTMIALTSPASTSALTFSVGVESSNGTTVYVNRSVRDNDGSDFDARSASTITVMEIGG